jgi:hypothetical protein
MPEKRQQFQPAISSVGNTSNHFPGMETQR